MKVKRQRVLPIFKITSFFIYRTWFDIQGPWSAFALNLNTQPLGSLSSHQPRTTCRETSFLKSQEKKIQKSRSIILGNSDNTHHSIPESAESVNYNNLPRLYVGVLPSGKQHTTSNILDHSRRLNLSPDQSHYLLKVIRIFSKKKKKKRKKANIYENDELSSKSSNFDISDCVRLFDGINGEWLCRVINPKEETMETSGTKQPKKQRLKSDLVAECLFQLRPQYHSSDFSETTSDERKQSREEHSATFMFHIEPDDPWLLFAPIKTQRAKMLIEKCTELGCGLFCPVITEHTDQAAYVCLPLKNENSQATIQYDLKASNDSKKGSKLPIVAREATEQCERLTVPAFVSTFDLFQGCEIEGTKQSLCVQDLLQNWVTLQKESHCVCGRKLLICRERKNTESQPETLQILDAFDKINKERSAPLAFFVGPEGGWSNEEEKLFDQYCANYPEFIAGVSLGNTVLRAETAGVMAIGAYKLWCSSSKR